MDQETVIICTVMPYEGSLEEAEAAIRDSYSHLETPVFVYGANSVTELPHPSQVQEVSQWAEENGLLDARSRKASGSR